MRSALALAVLLIATTARGETLASGIASHQHERLTCSIAAAQKFGVPANIMLAVAEMEGGHPGQRVRNRNGSLDVGPMQFNTRYLQHLERRYGITAADVAAAGCYPYELAAWRLRKHLELDTGDLWTRIANYHSRSPAQNGKYRRKLVRKAAAWARRLSDRVPTNENGAFDTRGGPALGKTTRRRKQLQPDNADESTLLIVDNGADVELLVKLLGDSDDETLRPTAAPDSRSGGSARVGSLRRAVQLPTHAGYVVRDPSRAWGTADTIARLTSAFDDVIRADPSAPRVRVHDLSLQNGGPMRGHKSHQSGRDVDITYYRRTCQGECAAQPASASELDTVRQWRLLRQWLEHGDAEFIFLDYALQPPLYEQATSEGATPRQLAQWFQYPRGHAFPGGVIRHVPNHANHVHVRFRCARIDRACHPTLTRPLSAAGDLVSMAALAADQDENELLDLVSQ